MALVRYGFLALAALLPMAHSVQASEPDQIGVEATLTSFMNDFNANRTGTVCSIFARDLRYDYIGFPERGYDDVCDVLNRSLKDSRRQYHYAVEIKEILVTGDLAVARVVWTLTITPKPAGSAPPAVVHEHSMDIFRAQHDGSWKLIRFNAYADP